MTDIEIPEGFTRWDGGDCPTPPMVRVEYIMRFTPQVFVDDSANLRWRHDELGWAYSDADIIAYRIVSDA